MLTLGEILLVLVVLLLIFGASRIPQLGAALGKALLNLRKSLRDDERSAPKGPGSGVES